MSRRREQKEALRREREERERKAREEQQRKRMVGFGAAGLLVVAVIVVLVVVAAGGNGGGGGEGQAAELLPDGGSVPEQQEFDLAPAARAAGCELRSRRASDRTHTTSLDAVVNYDTNPPTSGRHYQFPAEDGAYGEAPQDEELVHSLEHGRVIVWFKPSLSEDQRADLKAFFDEDSYQMLLVPRSNMRYQVAASAWSREPEENGTGRLLVCERMTPEVFDALRTFRDEHRSNGPEPIP
ncbi:MAG TPA: DUF3105 domain-containing protein [Thermoleophilaceae bacterium]|nr:DUF3105 domain-containing protein [Thermoleophilaceae bacterium]